MKLKSNEVAIFLIEDEYGNYYDRIYIFGDNAKGLRKNSRHITFWNGRHHVTHSIKFLIIKKFELIGRSPVDIPSSFRKIKIDDEVVTLYSSNITGCQTPFMVHLTFSRVMLDAFPL